MDIDFVVTWVDDADGNWIKKRDEYGLGTNASLNGEERYRNWNNFECWFRAVEKFAPWVHRVFLITEGHLPKWINKKNDKLICVKHSDYIDKKYLPTFNSNVIETNIMNIKSLSENFVLFNDDTILNKQVKPTDFFSKNGKPKDTGIFSPIIPQRNSADHMVLNNVEIINSYFTSREVLRNNFFGFFNLKYSKYIVKNFSVLPWSRILGFYDTHIPVSYRKSSFDQFWRKEKKSLLNNNTHRFRTDKDISHWVIRYWQLCNKNGFESRKVNFGKYYDIAKDLEKVCIDLKKSKHSMLCLNDSNGINSNEDFIKYKSVLNRALFSKFPQKSSFEV